MTLSSCSDLPNVENNSAEKDLSKTVIDFLKWYKDNNARLNNIQLVNHPNQDDTSSYYTVNYDSTAKYLFELKKSGYLSDVYLNTLDEHFKSSGKELAETKQNDGPATGFECDFIMKSQDYESDLDSIDKNTKIIETKINKEIGYVLVRFLYEVELEYHLSRVENKWLIDKIN